LKIDNMVFDQEWSASDETQDVEDDSGSDTLSDSDKDIPKKSKSKRRRIAIN